jgi:uncharacterized membrane protein YhfC
MALIGILAIALWRGRGKARWAYFAIGAIVWVGAIAAKAAMDFTITPILVAYVGGYSAAAYLALLGAYYGLRTGLLESGLSYIAALRRLRGASWEEAVAFGVGFGGIEAIALGLPNIVSILVLYFNPILIEQLPASVQRQLGLPTVVIFAPMMERLFSLLIHILGSLLAIYAAKERKPSYLAASVLYKALVDGIIPALGQSVDVTTVQGIYLAETPFVAIGLLTILCLRWMRRRYRTTSDAAGQ